MDPTPPASAPHPASAPLSTAAGARARRTSHLARAAALLAAAALAAGCGSTPATGAGGGAPGPARTIGDAPLPPAPTTAPAPGVVSPEASTPTAPPFGTLATPPATAPTTASATAPASACSPEGVALTVGPADAAMGLRVLPVRLTNCGTRPYTLKGHPAVRVLDAERAPLAVTVKHGSAGIATLENFDAAPRPVTLQPQEYAEFQLVWRNTVTSGSKGADNGRFLDVAPLPGRPRLTVPAELDLGTTGRLGVAPWTRPTG
ncbi:DUF4232 domain-containing protein [Kitasatospora sp. NPDC093806]|uniref:DUF4232 domain-containing protein n=1 Tax=Kitasatospora sp. NPDC093806 TaxID=3155075 RepID=UPI00344740F4